MNSYKKPPAPPWVYLLLIVAFMVAIGLPLAALVSWLDLPVVHRSHSTGNCVQVEDPAAQHENRAPWTCSNLPDRYETIWVR